MRYVSVLREILIRLNYHSNSELLHGLNIKRPGEFRLDGEADIPMITLFDFNVSESPGKATGRVSMLLRTKRKDEWVKLTDEGRNGLVDWMERVQDAIETRPSDGIAELMLTPHNTDGTLKLDVAGNPLPPLLPVEINWDNKMAEITDLSFTMQLDLIFYPTMTRRATRRTRPIAPTVGP
jgi:hypothetical protein